MVGVGHILLTQHSSKKPYIWSGKANTQDGRIPSRFLKETECGICMQMASSRMTIYMYFHYISGCWHVTWSLKFLNMTLLNRICLYWHNTAIAKKQHFSWENFSKDKQVAHNKRLGADFPPKKYAFFLGRSWTTQKMTINYGQLAKVLAYLVILKQVSGTFYHTKSTTHSWKQKSKYIAFRLLSG